MKIHFKVDTFHLLKRAFCLSSNILKYLFSKLLYGKDHRGLAKCIIKSYRNTLIVFFLLNMGSWLQDYFSVLRPVHGPHEVVKKQRLHLIDSKYSCQ